MKKYIALVVLLLIGCSSEPLLMTLPPPLPAIAPTVETTIEISNELSPPTTLPDGMAGAYFPDTGVIVCFDKWECLHEIAHKIDYEYMGQFSTSKEWADIVDYYREEIFISTGDLDKIEDRIFSFPGIGGNDLYEMSEGIFWGGYSEIYASILEQSKGIPDNMPEIFREYYDWEKIPELLNKFYKE